MKILQISLRTSKKTLRDEKVNNVHTKKNGVVSTNISTKFQHKGLRS